LIINAVWSDHSASFVIAIADILVKLNEVMLAARKQYQYLLM